MSTTSGKTGHASATELTRPEDGYHETKCAAKSLTHPSIMARLIVAHLNPLIDRGSSQPYTFKDLFHLGPEYEEIESRKLVESVLNSGERKGSSIFRWPFFWAVYAPIKGEFFKGLFLTFLSSCTSVAFPIFLRLLLEWIQKPGAADSSGFLWAGLLAASTLLRSFFTSSGTTYLFSSSGTVAHRLCYALGDRISKLNDAGQKGKIISMFTTEMRVINRILTTGSDLVLNPIFIIIYTGMIVYVIGWFGILAPALVFLFLPFQNKLESFYMKNLRNRFVMAEQRSKILAESIEGIKGIKFSAWENLVCSRIDAVRLKEKGLILAGQLMDSLSEASLRVIPLAGTIIVLWAYPAVYSGKTLSLPDTYFLIGVITMFGRPVTMMVWGFVSYVNAVAALQRIEDLVKSQEPAIVKPSTDLPVGTIALESCSFTWGKQKKQEKEEEKPSGSTEKNGKPGTEQKNEPNDQEPVILKDITVTFSPGELVAVVGPVAAGKSTLLLSLLSAVKRLSGSLRFNGSMAFVPQEPFLLNDTIKNNVTFGLDFDELLFAQAMRISQLDQDLAEFPGREDTEIGERGINLSGGQKQRVSIARAVYAQSDILVADDCLSALDAYVGKRVFEQVICGSFAGKTRIFVTHQLHYLEDERVDRVVFLKEGRVQANGSYKQLMESDAEFRDFVASGKEKHETVAKKEMNIIAASNPSKLEDIFASIPEGKPQKKAEPTLEIQNLEEIEIETERRLVHNSTETKQDLETAQTLKGKLTKQELKFTGQVPGRIYWKYMKAGGVGLVIMCITLYLLNAFLMQVANYWAGKWTQKAEYVGISTDTGFGVVYVVIGVLVLLTFTFRSLLYGLFGANSGYYIYHTVILNVLKRPMRFFDTTPNGVVMNRCSDDVAQVDFTLSLIMGAFLDSASMMVVGVIIVMVILPYLIVICLLIVAMVSWSFHRYLLTVVELRRLSTLALSPVINRISECLTGAVSLRAYNKTAWVRGKFERSLEVLSNTTAHDRLASTWMNFRLELAIGFLGTAVTFLIAAAKFSGFRVGPEGDSLDSMSVLFATVLTNTFNIGGNLSYLIFAFGEVSKGMGSVQRLVEYSEDTDLEPDWDSPPPPSPHWPALGAVSFRRLSARYRPGLPLVLRSFSCDILPRQKVGIVGRTGSGKSSLLLCLLRMLFEDPADRPDPEAGVFVDGVRIDQVGLHHLRRAVAVIPQDPMLLQGTVASNVDPMATADSSAVLQSLRQVQFFDTVKTEEVVAQRLKKLTAKLGRDPTDDEAAAEKSKAVSDEDKMALEVEGKGANLSLGQRQLICISRCLIRKPKILLMDEATANIDQKTDAIIQRVVKRDLPESTVITIAHRLLTVAQYDKIVVLANGEKVEEGSPGELLETKGQFQKLVEEGGPDFAHKMKLLASNLHVDLDQL